MSSSDTNETTSTSSNGGTPTITMNKKHHAPSVILNNNDDPANNVDPSIDATSLANAAHLDQLESSEAVTDIASFGEVDLSNVDMEHVDLGSPRTTGDVESGATAPSTPEGVRRAKKFYYCLPMLNRHKVPIIGCVVIFCVLLMAVSVGVAGLSEAEGGSKNNNKNGVGSGNGNSGGMIIDDAPNYQGYDNNNNNDNNNNGGYGNEEVGDPMEIEEETNFKEDHEEVGNVMEEVFTPLPQVPREDDGDEEVGDVMEEVFTPLPQVPREDDGDEEVGDVMEEVVTPLPEVPREDDGDEEVGNVMEEVVTPRPTDSPREPAPAPSPSLVTSAPTFPPHPRNPRWYQTSHAKYQTLIETHSDSGHHSHLIAGLFCVQFDLFLCGYDEYCPNGKRKRPYKNGPPKPSNVNSLEAVQWAPIFTADTTNLSSAQGGSWVQVGEMPESDGGEDSNGHGSCWTYDDWETTGGDIEVKWGEDHRRWILCCEREDTGNGWNGDEPDDRI